MRTPFAAIALAISAAGCSTPDFAAEFAAAVRELPSDGQVIATYRGGKPRRYTVSIDPETVPAPTRRTVDEFVQPEGTTVFTGREWGEAGNGYRIVKVYGEDRSWRSLLVNATGDVLERSHQIPLDQSPLAARAKVKLTVEGKIVGVGVIQRKLREADHYRFEVTAEDGREWYVVTTADGTLVEHGREVGATIFSGR